MSGRLSIVTPPPFDFLPLHHRQLLATDFISLYVGIRTFPSRTLPLGSPTTTSQHHSDIGVLAMSLGVYALPGYFSARVRLACTPLWW